MTWGCISEENTKSLEELLWGWGVDVGNKQDKQVGGYYVGRWWALKRKRSREGLRVLGVYVQCQVETWLSGGPDLGEEQRKPTGIWERAFKAAHGKAQRSWGQRIPGVCEEQWRDQVVRMECRWWGTGGSQIIEVLYAAVSTGLFCVRWGSVGGFSMRGTRDRIGSGAHTET